MPRFERSVLLYNGAAGASTNQEILPLVISALAGESKNLLLVQTETKEEFEAACITYADSADVLFVAGGDGTVHSAVQALCTLDEAPVLGILPSGTCNDFARTLEIPLALGEAAEALVAGEVKRVDTALANQHSFLNFAGIGMITDASANIDPDLKERYGKLSYFMSALQTMRQAESFDVTLKIDGVYYSENAVAVLVMNGKSIGTHTFPLAEIDPTDGLLDIFIIQTSSIAAIREWFSLSQPGVATDDLEHITHFRGKNIVLTTEQEMEVDTDGEIYLTTPLDINIQPQHIKMLVPKQQEQAF